MKRSVLLAALAALSVAGAKANAGTLFDSPLTSPPGFYNGTGGVNAGFTVVQDNLIELGLRASDRFQTVSPNGVIHPSGSNYQVLGGLHDAGHGFWNYDYSIDLTHTTLTLGSIIATLTVLDVTTGQHADSLILDPSFTTDNSAPGNLLPGHPVIADATSKGAQNSENPVFGNFALDVFDTHFFADHSADAYQFTLTVSTATDGVLATDTIGVATPLPATVWQGAALLGGLGLFAAAKRRRPMPAI